MKVNEELNQADHTALPADLLNSLSNPAFKVITLDDCKKEYNMVKKQRGKFYMDILSHVLNK